MQPEQDNSLRKAISTGIQNTVKEISNGNIETNVVDNILHELSKHPEELMSFGRSSRLEIPTFYETIKQLAKEEELAIFISLLKFIESQNRIVIIQITRVFEETSINFKTDVLYLTKEECIANHLEPTHQILDGGDLNLDIQEAFKTTKIE